LSCHPEAANHADDLQCIDCHWPATHAATPNANRFGGYEEMELVLPKGAGVVTTTTSTTQPGATTTTTAPNGRDTFARTGTDFGLILVLSAVLLGTGWVLRRRGARD